MRSKLARLFETEDSRPRASIDDAVERVLRGAFWAPRARVRDAEVIDLASRRASLAQHD